MNDRENDCSRALGIVCRRRAFRDYESIVGRINNPRKRNAAFLTIESIAFKPRRIDIGRYAAAEVEYRMALRAERNIVRRRDRRINTHRC
jgi:hypothetical protein